MPVSGRLRKWSEVDGDVGEEKGMSSAVTLVAEMANEGLIDTEHWA